MGITHYNSAIITEQFSKFSQFTAWNVSITGGTNKLRQDQRLFSKLVFSDLPLSRLQRK